MLNAEQIKIELQHSENNLSAQMLGGPASLNMFAPLKQPLAFHSSESCILAGGFPLPWNRKLHETVCKEEIVQ